MYSMPLALAIGVIEQRTLVDNRYKNGYILVKLTFKDFLNAT